MLVPLGVAAGVVGVIAGGVAAGALLRRQPAADPAGRPVLASVPGPFLSAAAPRGVVPAHGPVPRAQRPCTAGLVSGSATTRRSTYGVLGVVRLRGRHCTLEVREETLVLLDAAGRSLGVPRRAEPLVNPGSVMRPDLAEAAGSVDVGFAWRGAWCGPRAAAVWVSALPGPGTPAVTVPLRGAVPACSPGGPSRLVAGVLGRPGEAVQSAPPAWGALVAQLQLPSRTGNGVLRFRVRLRNTGTETVTLDPCPRYRLNTTGTSAGGIDISSSEGSLPCGARLAPGGNAEFPVSYDLRGGDRTGLLRLDWAMAGAPTASGTVRIR